METSSTIRAQRARRTKEEKDMTDHWQHHVDSPQSLASVGMRHDGTPGYAAALAAPASAKLPQAAVDSPTPDLAV
jgi:hypothetical protein